MNDEQASNMNGLERAIAMEFDQLYYIKSGDELRASSMIDAVMKKVESDRITRLDVERYLAHLRDESIANGYAPDQAICDMIEDPVAFRLVADKIYAKVVQSRFDALRQTGHDSEGERERLKDYIHAQYHHEKEYPFRIDYERLSIMSGISYQEQLRHRQDLYEVKRIVNFSESDLSTYQKIYEDTLDPFIHFFIELLNSPAREEVKSTCKKLFLMDKQELKAFLKDEFRPPLKYIAHMLYEL
jgi:hypothetical protein